MVTVHYDYPVANPPPTRIERDFTFQDASHPSETKAQFKARILAQFDTDWDEHPPLT